MEKKNESAKTALETANILDAKLDTQMSGDPFNSADHPVMPTIDPNTIIELQDFDFGTSPVEIDPPTLLDELVKVAEQVEKKNELVKERNDDIKLVNTERDQKLCILAQTHLPSRYYEAKQEILISAHAGKKWAIVATFQCPLSAYDETLITSLKRMFIADAMSVTDIQNQKNIELRVMW